MADYVSLTAQRELFLTVPPIDEQRAVVLLLHALDRKIDLNGQMNKTLEVTAQAIFRSWFVDFDPVVAKVAGHQPFGMDAATDALFPDQFVESEIGLIPQGWRVGTVGNLGQVVCGKTPSTLDEKNFGTEIPFITIPDMHQNVFITSTERSLSLKGAESQPKKYLPKGSVCVSCIATPGLVAITSGKSQTNQQINSVIPSKEMREDYVYWILRDLADDILAGGSGGTVFHNLNTTNFSNLRILIAEDSVRNIFHDRCGPIMDLILLNQQEMHTLANLRDTLLPKLLCGDIPIKQVEQVIQQAV